MGSRTPEFAKQRPHQTIYGFDLDALAPHAARCGPTLRDFGQNTDEDPTFLDI